MTIKALIAAAAAALTLAGCATTDIASRNAAFAAPTGVADVQQQMRDYAVADIQVTVPRNLRVSEANSYYPLADIVWRGDAVGDRHAQVGAILQEAMGRAASDLAASDLAGADDVIASITLLRWHGVTERTRYSIGGVYSIRFMLEIRDARTGEVIEAGRVIQADLPAPGGQAAVALEQSGQTEKVRVTDHLAHVLLAEFTGAVPADI